MNNLDLRLEKIFDLESLELMLGDIARAFGISINLIEYKGSPVMKPCNFSEFCQAERSLALGKRRCMKCDALAGLEAARLGEPYIYYCHYDIAHAAVAITVGEQYLGAVICGQVKLKLTEDDPKVTRLLSESLVVGSNPQSVKSEMQRLYEKLPELSYEKLRSVANIVNSVLRYMLDRAVSEQLDNQTAQWLHQQNYPSDSFEKKLRDKENRTASAYKPIPLPPDNVLYPALLYIEENPGKMVSMQEMAQLCHLSHSYFSKLFQRELKENFTDYVSRRKVQLAKKMLYESSDSVTTIAASLGFMDTSYFIKVFKKFEGVTPLAYRQIKYRSIY